MSTTDYAKYTSHSDAINSYETQETAEIYTQIRTVAMPAILQDESTLIYTIKSGSQIKAITSFRLYNADFEDKNTDGNAIYISANGKSVVYSVGTSGTAISDTDMIELNLTVSF